MKIDSPVLDGLFCINKNAGSTSFETIRDLKKRLGIRKLGHTGTLDKFASGLLIVLTGGCTRLNTIFLGLDKEYRARVCLGAQTDTLDPEGTIIARSGIPALDDIIAVLPDFTGDILQRPPLYSALHVDGERAYKIARRGDNIELPPRPIRIHGIKIVEFDPPFLTIDVECSSGTYIRSLARDIGKAAGSNGYLVELVRKRIGKFSLEDSIRPDDPDSGKYFLPPHLFFERLEGCGIRIVKNEYVDRISHGMEPREEFFKEKTDLCTYYALFDENRTFLAVVRKDESRFSYITVLNRGNS
jgi:tRNA pseudouridine55 synthase